jgi:hypothetical protein
MSIADEIFDLAQSLAAEIPGFERRRGPGREAGDGMTQSFIRALDEQVSRRWPAAVDLQRSVANGVGYTFDYFIESEHTAVEIALSLRNPLSEFEKDVFKAILAKEAGLAVRRLVLIGRKGAEDRLKAPGPKAIISWLAQHRGIEVLVKDLT